MSVKVNSYNLKSVKEANLHKYRIEEVACALTGLDFDEIDADESIMDAELSNQFGITLESFGKIINRIMPMIAMSHPRTGDKVAMLVDGYNRAVAVYSPAREHDNTKPVGMPSPGERG